MVDSKKEDMVGVMLVAPLSKRRLEDQLATVNEGQNRAGR